MPERDIIDFVERVACILLIASASGLVGMMLSAGACSILRIDDFEHLQYILTVGPGVAWMLGAVMAVVKTRRKKE